MVADYTEPAAGNSAGDGEGASWTTGRSLCHATIRERGALRSIRVRPLPDEAAAPGASAPVVDATFRND
jgi:hypothetical protein